MDNLEQRRPQDSGRINVNESWELRYWCKALGVSEERLREVVRKVGTGAEKVREHLKGH